MRFAFSPVASQQFETTRTIVSLTAAQLFASGLSRYFVLTDLRLFPAWKLHPFEVAAATRQDVTVALLAAAVTAVLVGALGNRWRHLPLGALAILAYMHCALLGINAVAVHWLGSPLTLQWLYFADLLQSHTPRSAVAAVATPGSLAIVAVIALAPLWTGFLIRSLTNGPKSTAWLPRFATAMFVASTLLAASAALRPLGGNEFINIRESPVLALANSLFTPTPRFLEQASKALPEEYVAVPASSARLSQSTRPNIILIVLESVGAKAVEAERERMPVLDELMTKGRYYPNTYVATASSPRSLFSLLLSRSPLLGVQREIEWLSDRGLVSLPQLLQRHGYDTAFFGVDLDYAGARSFLLKHGFERSRDILDEGCRSSRRLRFASEASDHCLFTVAADWAVRSSKPFFLTIWSNDTHSPYTSNGSGLAPGSLEAYRQSLVTSDRAIGQFLQQLRTNNLLENSIVLVVGDHGEAFGEHGQRVHSTTIFEEEVRVPLILWKDGSGLSGQEFRLARLIDVSPTILDLATGDAEKSWSGVSLTSGLAPKRVFFFSSTRGVQIGFRQDKTKYVLDYGKGRFSKYHLVRDPDERTAIQLSDQERKLAEARVAAWVQRERNRYRD